MDFLHEKFNMTTADPGLADTFFADIIQPRPDFETLVAFNDWSAKFRQEMTTIKARKNCPVAWVGFFVDQDGMSIVLHFEHPLMLCHAKTAARNLTRPLAQDMQKALQSNLRPLDELDRKRIDGWRTQASLRPRGSAARGDSAAVGEKHVRQQAEEQELFVSINTTDGKRREVAANIVERQMYYAAVPSCSYSSADGGRDAAIARFIADNDSDEEESAARGGSVDLPVAPSLLSIQDASAARGSAYVDVGYDLRVLTDPLLNWAHRLKTECTVVVAEVGQRPVQLTWVSCHHEVRKIAFLVHTVQESYGKPGLVSVVRVAAAMAKEGSLPDHTGARGRKSEFLKRCAKALEIVNANAEKDVKKLSKEERDTIRLILGEGGEPYSGCFNEGCLDQKTTWVEKNVGWERCSRCNLPKSCGRSWKTGSDLMRNQNKAFRIRALYPCHVPIVYLDDSDDEEMPTAA